VDLEARRTAPFPAHLATQLDKMRTEHQNLGWEAPVCGVMGV
jgi:hypothetical protein